MMKFVTIFGTDPEAVAQPEPLKPVPPHIQIVDAKGNVVASYDTTADFEEITANMTAINEAKMAEHQAELSAKTSNPMLKTDGKTVEIVPEEPAPDPVQLPVPDAQQQYQSLLYRCKLDVEMHNGQFPDDPWTLQEEQDVTE
jgi:hypothetical protein